MRPELPPDLRRDFDLPDASAAPSADPVAEPVVALSPSFSSSELDAPLFSAPSISCFGGGAEFSRHENFNQLSIKIVL